MRYLKSLWNECLTVAHYFVFSRCCTGQDRSRTCRKCEWNLLQLSFEQYTFQSGHEWDRAILPDAGRVFQRTSGMKKNHDYDLKKIMIITRDLSTAIYSILFVFSLLVNVRSDRSTLIKKRMESKIKIITPTTIKAMSIPKHWMVDSWRLSGRSDFDGPNLAANSTFFTRFCSGEMGRASNWSLILRAVSLYLKMKSITINFFHWNLLWISQHLLDSWMNFARIGHV